MEGTLPRRRIHMTIEWGPVFFVYYTSHKHCNLQLQTLMTAPHNPPRVSNINVYRCSQVTWVKPLWYSHFSDTPA